MSKRSRERRKLAKVNRDGVISSSKTTWGGKPIVGTMAERMQTMARIEHGADDGSEMRTAPTANSQLPIHYGGAARGDRMQFADENGDYWHDEKKEYGRYIQGQWQPKYPKQGHWDGTSWIPSGATHIQGFVQDVGYRKIEDQTTFRCDSEDVTAACPIHKVPEIYVNRLMFNQWIGLAEDFDVEWLAYLEGAFDAEKNRYNITKMYFPPQTANGAHVDVDDDFEPLPGTIGAVHSHVKMSVFFSQEDMRHSNWPVELVVNAKGEIKAMVRSKLECGKFAKYESKVWLTGDASHNGFKSSLEKAFDRGKKLEEIRRAGQTPRAVSSLPAEGEVTTPPTETTKSDSVPDATGHSVLASQNGQSAEDAALEASVDEQVAQEMARRGGVLPERRCPRCNGRSWVEATVNDVLQNRCTGEGDPIECPLCEGTGLVPIIELEDASHLM